ncbi:uncharacterized protein LOC143997658 [Lithobates pipiens]
MDTKYERSGKSPRQRVSHSISPKLEVLGSGNVKVPVCNNYGANLGKNSSVASLPPAITKDRKYPSLESVNSSPLKTSVRNELGSNEKVSRKFEPLKPSSLVETQNSDIYLQRRPINLAPLNLPEEVKEAQLKKMKDEVYLAKKSSKKTDKTMKAISDRPMKRDPLNKVGMAEKTLEEVKVENNLSEEGKGPQDHKPNTVMLFGNTGERMSSSSTIKFKSGHVHNSVPKIVTVDSTDISIKGRFNHPKSCSAIHNIRKPVSQ